MINPANPFRAHEAQPFKHNNVISFGQAKDRMSAAQAQPASPFHGPVGLPRFGASSQAGKGQVAALAGSFSVAPHVLLEAQLIHKLGSYDNNNDPKGENRAIIAEMLGRSQSNNALKAILGLTQPDVPLAARTSAYKAMSRIAEVSSYGRVDIGRAAIQQYEERLKALQEFLDESLKAQKETLGKAEETGTDPDVYIDMVRKHKQDVDVRFEEIKALTEAIGAADFPAGKKMLRDAYHERNGAAEYLTQQLHLLERGLISAQGRFFDKIERRDGDDLEEIIDQIPAHAFSNLLMDTPVHVGDETMPFSEALSMYFATIQGLKLNEKIQEALAKGLTRRPDVNDLAALEIPVKLASAPSTHGLQRLVAPSTTSVSMKALAPFRETNYPEIKRFLTSGSSVQVRRAALESLLFSKDEQAKEHVLDMLNPYNYFRTVGFPRSYGEFRKLLDGYIRVISMVVYRGDDFVDNLIERAHNIDADLTTRKMSVMALGFMVQKPYNREIDELTQEKAKEALADLSKDTLDQNPYARLGWQADEIRLMATKMSLMAKNPEAVNSAIELLLNPGSTVENEEKENLLAVFYQFLLEDHDEARKDEPGSPDAKSPLDRKLDLPDRMQHLLLDSVFKVLGPASMMESWSEGVIGRAGDSAQLAKTFEFVNQYKATLEPDAIERLKEVGSEKSEDLAPPGFKRSKDGKSLVPMTRHQRRDVPDTQFIANLKHYIDGAMRPAMTTLLKDDANEGTVWTRALSARILGLLADRGSTDTLLEVLKDPFKGKEKWARSNSHGTQSAKIDGIILRASILSALGHIGTRKALEPMLEALKDPYLGYQVVEEALAQIAPEVNKGAPDINKVRTALIMMPPELLEEKVNAWFMADPRLAELIGKRVVEETTKAGQKPKTMVMTEHGPVPIYSAQQILMGLMSMLDDPATASALLDSQIGRELGYGTPDAGIIKAIITEMTPEEFMEEGQKWFPEAPNLFAAMQAKCRQSMKLMGQEPQMVMSPIGPIEVFPPGMMKNALLSMLENPATAGSVIYSPIGDLGLDASEDTPELQKVREALTQVIANPRNTRWQRYVRINAANTLAQFNGGPEALVRFIEQTRDPNFKLHAASALITNDIDVDPDTPVGRLVEAMKKPLLGVDEIHEKEKLSGKGVDVAVVDGGYVYGRDPEIFPNLHLPPEGTEYTEHTHPTMVTTTLAGNGVITGVAPGANIYSQKWPSWDPEADSMDTMKTLIEGKLRGENNIRVINNSWGLVSNEFLQYRDVRKRMKEFKRLVEMAELAGVQLVFSAGNSGEEAIFPGLGQMDYGVDIDKWTDEEKENLDYILDKVITVGAVNHKGSRNYADHELADFSTTGDFLNPKIHPTVVAPGQDMMVHSYQNGQLSKELVNGTSFSGPFVSGLLTLMVEANPEITPAQMREILVKTAVKLPNLTVAQQGGGEVNPAEAIKQAKALNPKLAARLARERKASAPQEQEAPSAAE